MINIERPIVVCTIGFLIGIIYGLYFEKSIAFILPIILLVYILITRKFSKYKLVKYLKVFFSKKSLLTITICALISNTYILVFNFKYNSFYQNPPDLIQTYAIVIRRLSRERIYKYVYNKIRIRKI